MKALYNEQIIALDSLSLDPDNRAFQYGDGLFETLISTNGNLLFFNEHYQRLVGGMNTLKLDLPEFLSTDFLQSKIKLLLEENHPCNPARIKIMVWRKFGGLYKPIHHEAQLLVMCNPSLYPSIKTCHKVAFAKSVFNRASINSGFKNISAVKYVLAGLEMSEDDLDEIIILDDQENISECLASNLFWESDGVFYTPSPETGCVEGIRRNWVIRQLKKNHYPLQVGSWKKEELLSADSVFNVNVAGLTHIMRVDDIHFNKNAWIEKEIKA